MTSDQMLWHVNQFLAASLGETSLKTMKHPMPMALLRFLVIYAPWPKSAPTNPSARARQQHDFESERARCKALIEKFTNRPIDGAWPVDPSFGGSNGKFASKLQAKHLDHHFKQFGG